MFSLMLGVAMLAALPQPLPVAAEVQTVTVGDAAVDGSFIQP
jgi:hypothetical protein